MVLVSEIAQDIISTMKEESMDYDDNQLQPTNFDNISNSYGASGFFRSFEYTIG